MTRIRTAAAAAALPVAAGLLLTGCGIKPTGVVESGAPAKVRMNAPGTRPLVYFVGPEDRLLPTPVTYDSDGVKAAVIRVLVGPNEQEKAAGLRTELPRTSLEQAAAVLILSPGDDLVEVRLPIRVGDLSQQARRQLVCTVLSTSPSRYEAVLRGPDTALEPALCTTGP